MSTLSGVLHHDKELAFVILTGAGTWKATRDILTQNWPPTRYCIWHIPSGPLPLVNVDSSVPCEWINDPWAGWTERRARADNRVPFFGAGHPGVFWLNLRISPKMNGHVCGLSSFEWIGDRYKLLGSPAKVETTRAWNRLRQRIGSAATRVPRGQLSSGQPPAIWALPHAYNRLSEGLKADRNPA